MGVIVPINTEEKIMMYPVKELKSELKSLRLLANKVDKKKIDAMLGKVFKSKKREIHLWPNEVDFMTALRKKLVVIRKGNGSVGTFTKSEPLSDKEIDALRPKLTVKGGYKVWESYANKLQTKRQQEIEAAVKKSDIKPSIIDEIGCIPLDESYWACLGRPIDEVMAEVKVRQGTKSMCTNPKTIKILVLEFNRELHGSCVCQGMTDVATKMANVLRSLNNELGLEDKTTRNLFNEAFVHIINPAFQNENRERRRVDDLVTDICLAIVNQRTPSDLQMIELISRVGVNVTENVEVVNALSKVLAYAPCEVYATRFNLEVPTASVSPFPSKLGEALGELQDQIQTLLNKNKTTLSDSDSGSTKPKEASKAFYGGVTPESIKAHFPGPDFTGTALNDVIDKDNKSARTLTLEPEDSMQLFKRLLTTTSNEQPQIYKQLAVQLERENLAGEKREQQQEARLQSLEEQVKGLTDLLTMQHDINQATLATVHTQDDHMDLLSEQIQKLANDLTIIDGRVHGVFGKVREEMDHLEGMLDAHAQDDSHYTEECWCDECMGDEIKGSSTCTHTCEGCNSDEPPRTTFSLGRQPGRSHAADVEYFRKQLLKAGGVPPDLW